MLQPLLRPVAVAANDRLHGASTLALPAPPALDLDFVGRPSLQYPGLPPIAFTRASTAARVNASGLVETVAADAPRFDHHPMTGARWGLLIEEARTNLIPRSEDFAHAAWTKDNATVGAAASGPDGNASAQALIEDTGTGQHRARQTGASFTAGATLAVSCFLKAAGRGFATLQFGAANGFRACFDLEAGALASGFAGEAFGTGAFVSAGIQPMPGGWRRCWVVGQEDPAATEGEAYLNIVRGPAYTDSYAGDGAGGIRAWGYQMEAGAFPTSYIATADTTATRAADVATLDVITPWYNAAEGTIFAECEIDHNNQATTEHIVSIKDGTSSDNALNLLRNANSTLRAAIRSGGGLSAGFNSSAAPVSGVQALIMAYGADNFAAVFNAESAQVDTFGLVPIAPTNMQIGNSGSGSYNNGHIRRIVYWPIRWSDTQLRFLSSQ
ncbi:MAG: phage head spike fiber domain-containing protein [Alphaproteobacteria bacterium]